MEDFEQHLSDLYQTFGPDLAQIPSSEEVLSGVVDAVIPKDFNLRLLFGLSLVQELIKVWVRYGKKSNILVDTKLQRFFNIIEKIELELQIKLVRDLLDQGISLSKFEQFKTLTDEFGELLSKN